MLGTVEVTGTGAGAGAVEGAGMDWGMAAGIGTGAVEPVATTPDAEDVEGADVEGAEGAEGSRLNSLALCNSRSSKVGVGALYCCQKFLYLFLSSSDISGSMEAMSRFFKLASDNDIAPGVALTSAAATAWDATGAGTPG